jgi:hypothetical protein
MSTMRILSLLVVLLASCGDSKTGPDAPAADAPAALTCASYCDSIQSACQGGNAQYDSAASCLATCAKFPLGTSGDIANNSLACRITQASKATGDAATYCISAGPAGGDNTKPGTTGAVCGSACESFCKANSALCPTQYPSEADCLTTCSGFTPGLKFNAGIVSGDTLACRIYHMTLASVQPIPHCSHTSITPTPPCKAPVQQ